MRILALAILAIIWGGLGGGTGAGTDLRSQLSGLPACLWQDQLLRM